MALLGDHIQECVYRQLAQDFCLRGSLMQGPGDWKDQFRLFPVDSTAVTK